MDYNEIIEITKRYSDRVVDYMKPKWIILYGSYSNGLATSDSDIDIAVICDAIEDGYLEKSQQLFKLRRGIDSRIEPVLIELGNDKSGFCDEVLKTGRIIYSS